MTSNQISASLARENARHNQVEEQLQQKQLEETQRQNKRNTLIQAANTINQAAKTMSDSIGYAYNNQIQAANAATNQAAQVAEARYKTKMSDISTKQQMEQERYNKRQNELTLRNIQHLEYQDQLQALRDDWQRNVDINDATRANAEVTIKSAANTINSYLAEIQRANVNVNAYRTYMDALLNEYDMALKQAQTDEARARIVTNYINATTNLLDGIMGNVSNLLKLF